MKALLAMPLASLILLGCGAEGNGDVDEIPGGADADEARVIDQWSDALREGDVDAAAEFFELPSIAQNGTPVLELDSREDAVTFNASLPCGAELTEAEDHGRFTIATFELTERPGAGKCGAGVGETAKTAFVIEEGLITRWIRVVDEEELPPAEGPFV